VLGALPREQVSEFLSGLLIGAEVATLRDASRQQASRSSPGIANVRYQQAFAPLGEVVSGDTAFQAGIRSIAHAVAN
jgi:2-dehydro-3-deoxygalactonokinase